MFEFVGIKVFFFKQIEIAKNQLHSHIKYRNFIVKHLQKNIYHTKKKHVKEVRTKQKNQTVESVSQWWIL